MRILIATSNRAVVGGVETYLRALLPALRAQGHELGLICANPAAEGRPTVDDLCADLPVWIKAHPADVLAAANEWAPSVVYSQQQPDPTAEEALLGRFPTVLYAHDYNATCISGTKTHAFPAPAACFRRLSPLCLGLYYPRRCGGLNPITALGLYQNARKRQRLLPKYRAILVASRHMVNELSRNDLCSARIVLNAPFPNAIRPDPAAPTVRPIAGRILFVGRITALKGWRPLVAALSLASTRLGRLLMLTVAGDGPQRAAFEAEARTHAVPTEFVGWVDAVRRTALMRQADLLAIPSTWPEPFGLVGIEAGCVGLPAVGYAVGGITDWLIPGTSGELAPSPSTAESLAEAMVRALSDAAHWQRLREGAWQVSQQFSVESHLGRLIPILEEACGKGT